MKTRLHFIFIWLAIITCSILPFQIQAQQKNASYDKLATEILTLINEHRAGMGLKPLVINEVIIKAAESHSHNMAVKKIPFGHQGFDSRMDKLSTQLKPTNSFAENVAYGPTTAKEAVELWLTSSGHRENIEGNYNLTGIGIAKSKNGDLYYTEIFIRRGN